MRLIIFAGGIGTRLWPLSRQNSPKQFDKIFDHKSTLELAIDRISSFGLENIFVQTTLFFKPLVKKQIPNLPSQNIFIEPSRRNVGPAVCLAMHKLKQSGYHGAVAILWADHLMKRQQNFVSSLNIAEKLIEQNKNRFIFLAEKPVFANNNLGWINVGAEIGRISNQPYFEFKGWKYKPEPAECEHMFKQGNYFWNPGYFITSVDFILNQYKLLAPDIYNNALAAANGDNQAYNRIEKISFDRCLIEKTDLSNAIILKTNMGWTDPGTLYALKQALQKSEADNVVQGEVVNLNSSDCLVYNLEPKKLVTTVGLNGMVVVNTKDALIVVPKDKIKQVTDLVENISQQGYNNYV